jgi:hypothetical protein
MDNFTTSEIQTGETSIFVRSYGSGPPILLLHGFPQTQLMWRSVAPKLARIDLQHKRTAAVTSRELGITIVSLIPTVTLLSLQSYS